MDDQEIQRLEVKAEYPKLGVLTALKKHLGNLKAGASAGFTLTPCLLSLFMIYLYYSLLLGSSVNI